MTDNISDYYNFTHPHNAVGPGVFKHRLGNFQTPGGGQMQGAPTVGVLHVPVADFYNGGADQTAEIVAKYLSAPPENYEPHKHGGFIRTGCTHATSDRDSFVLCLPMDSVAWGCGNPNTGARSWEIEIAGWGKDTAEYWRGPDARLKLIQAARAHIAAAKLVGGDEWKKWVIPAQKAVLNSYGVCLTPGWTQHREIPYWNGYKWAQPPTDNLMAGQHYDICENFPYDVWFEVLNGEVNAA